MAAFLDGCRFNPAAGGTTDWTYSSPVTGYQSPAAANVVNGALYKYRAESADLGQWEFGEGAFNSGTGVLTRNRVLFNSAGTTAKINFSTVPQVAIVALAEDVAGPALLRGHLAGVILSTAGSSGTFAVSAGVCVDSTNSDIMAVPAFTKTNANWAVGPGNGGQTPGSLAANSWYHVHVVKRPDTGITDILVDPSATAPTLPANYTLFRRIGSLLTDGSNHWVKFVQLGDSFLWDVGVNNVSAFTGSTAIQTATLTTPPGVQVDAIIAVLSVVGSGGDGRGFIFSPDVNSPGTLAASLNTINFGVAGASGTNGVAQMNSRTNLLSQVKYALTLATGTVYITTLGWTDTRGKLS